MIGPRSRLSHLTGFLFALATLFAAPSAVLALDQGRWTATAVMGQAKITLPGKTLRSLLPGAKIQPGSEIVTDRGARVTLRRGKTSLTLSPASRLWIPVGSDRGRRTTVIQRYGALKLSVGKTGERAIHVRTDVLSAAAADAVFTVAVGVQGASVRVSDGTVEVGVVGDDEPALVQQGQMASVLKAPNADLKLAIDTGWQRARARRETGAPQSTQTEIKAGNASADPSAGQSAGKSAGMEDGGGSH